MSIFSNFRSVIQKIVRTDLRVGVRLYSDESENINTDAIDKDEKPIDPSKDRTKIIPVETSMKYLQSNAYQQAYGDKPVWFLYRRNFKGAFAPRKTRKSCVRNGIISTGNPCPICRDEYLVLDHRNIKLLGQFISEHTGQIHDAFKTGLCQKKQKELLVAIDRAWDHGYITFDVPIRSYNYSLYYKSCVNT